MSRLARRRAELPFTLFSFQDIMASVTGVVILVTLMLMLELAQRPTEGAPQPAATPMPVAVENAAELEARIEALRAALAAEAPVGPQQVAEAERSAEALRDLLRVLEAQGATQAASAAATNQTLEQTRDELQALTTRVEEAQRKFEVARAQTRVTLLEGDQGGKRTWFVECGADGVGVGRIGQDGVTKTEQRFGGDDAADELLRWALGQPKASERFVLLVRADGVAAFDRLQKVLRGAGYDVGWDLWTADVRVFPERPRQEASDAAPR